MKNLKQLNPNFVTRKVFYFISIYFVLIINSSALMPRFDQNEYFYFGTKNLTEYSWIYPSTHTIYFDKFIKILNLNNSNFKLYFQIIFIAFTVKFLIQLLDGNYKNLNTNLLALLIFFNLFNQNIFGGEYIFKTLEPKTLAYLFLLISIVYLFKENYFVSSGAYMFVIYLHLGVAVNFALPFILYIIFKKQFFNFIKLSLFPILLTLPALIAFIFTYLESIDPILVTENISSSTYLIKTRLDHHLYPFVFENQNFQNLNPEMSSGIYRFILLMIVYFVILQYKSKLNTPLIEYIVFTNFLILSQAIYLILIYLDPFSKWILIHPLRINSFILLLVLIIISRKLEIKNLFINITIVFLLFVNIYSFINNYISEQNTNDMTNKIYEYLVSVEPDYVLFPTSYSTSYWFDFEYKTGLSGYAHRKFNPFELKHINNWTYRLDRVGKFYEGDCGVFNSLDNIYFIDFDDKNSCGDLVFFDKSFYIFKIKD